MRFIVCLFFVGLFCVCPSRLPGHWLGAAEMHTYYCQESLALKQGGDSWQVHFTDHQYLAGNDKLTFPFEVFFNASLQATYPADSLKMINGLLAEFADQLSGQDVLTVILINENRLDLIVKNGNHAQRTSSGEILLHFYPDQPHIYSIETLPDDIAAKDCYFFYMEKSNGLKNLREFQNRLDSTVEDNHPFLVYFNGPGSEPVVIKDPSDRITLYNTLFTSVTQPPIPVQELQRVSHELDIFIAEQGTDINLKMYLYLSEVSYGLLMNAFILPLIEQYISSKNLANWQVWFMTDFEADSKGQRYNYINIGQTYQNDITQ